MFSVTPPSLSQPPPKQAPVNMVLESEVPRDQPPEFEFIAEPPSISAMEL